MNLLLQHLAEAGDTADIEKIKSFLDDSDVDINDNALFTLRWKEYSALDLAVESGRADIVKLLLSFPNLIIDGRAHYPLITAAINQDKTVFNLLYAEYEKRGLLDALPKDILAEFMQNTQPNDSKEISESQEKKLRTAQLDIISDSTMLREKFFAAIIAGNEATVLDCLQQAPHLIAVHQADTYNSGLLLAIKHNHLSIAQLLLQYGASVDFKNKDGKNAQDFARDLGDKEMLELFNNLSNTKFPQGIILGCGFSLLEDFNLQSHTHVHPRKDFITININKAVTPDIVANFDKDKFDESALALSNGSKYALIYMEHVVCNYDKDLNTIPLEQQILTTNLLESMSKVISDDGLIICNPVNVHDPIIKNVLENDIFKEKCKKYGFTVACYQYTGHRLILSKGEPRVVHIPEFARQVLEFGNFNFNFNACYPISLKPIAELKLNPVEDYHIKLLTLRAEANIQLAAQKEMEVRVFNNTSSNSEINLVTIKPSPIIFMQSTANSSEIQEATTTEPNIMDLSINKIQP